VPGGHGRSIGLSGLQDGLGLLWHCEEVGLTRSVDLEFFAQGAPLRGTEFVHHLFALPKKFAPLFPGHGLDLLSALGSQAPFFIRAELEPAMAGGFDERLAFIGGEGLDLLSQLPAECLAFPWGGFLQLAPDLGPALGLLKGRESRPVPRIGNGDRLGPHAGGQQKCTCQQQGQSESMVGQGWMFHAKVPPEWVVTCVELLAGLALTPKPENL
jgi:hypothetical protein